MCEPIDKHVTSADIQSHAEAFGLRGGYSDAAEHYQSD